MTYLRRTLLLSMLLCYSVLLVACNKAADTPSALPTEKPAGALDGTSATAPSVTPVESNPETGLTQNNSSMKPIEIPYTKENPVTDRSIILGFLDDLHQRQEAWFSRPGWYQKAICNHNLAGNDTWMTCLYVLVHITDGERTCREQMAYYIVEDQVMPFLIMLDDGTTAGFTVPAGEIGSVQAPTPAVQCRLDNLESVGVEGEALLINERAWFEGFENDLKTGGGSLEEGSGGTAGSIRAWQEKVGEQNFFALGYEITNFRAPQPVVIDPSTGLSLIIDRKVRLKLFDPNTGLPFSEQEILYLRNGQVSGGEWINKSQYSFFETLPDELTKVYTDTVERVLSEMGR